MHFPCKCCFLCLLPIAAASLLRGEAPGLQDISNVAAKAHKIAEIYVNEKAKQAGKRDNARVLLVQLLIASLVGAGLRKLHSLPGQCVDAGCFGQRRGS